MSTDTATEHTADHSAGAAHDDHHEVSDLVYVKVAVLLAVVTAAEVALPYLADATEGPVPMPVAIPLLLMMVLKFFFVGAYFMHLKYDSVMFRRAFVSGIVLAVLVYIAALATFQFWS